MVLKYDIEMSSNSIKQDLKKITNQIYKLLPEREEGADWQTPLSTIVEEIAGMHRLLVDHQQLVFPLLCKLEGLFTLTSEDDFFLYRRTIFECLSLIGVIMNQCQD